MLEYKMFMSVFPYIYWQFAYFPIGTSIWLGERAITSTFHDFDVYVQWINSKIVCIFGRIAKKNSFPTNTKLFSINYWTISKKPKFGWLLSNSLIFFIFNIRILVGFRALCMNANWNGKINKGWNLLNFISDFYKIFINQKYEVWMHLAMMIGKASNHFYQCGETPNWSNQLKSFLSFLCSLKSLKL